MSLVLCLAIGALWTRSYWIMDFKPFTTETAGGHRYWELVSYRGGIGAKITDNWPMSWRSADIYHSENAGVPQWAFFPGGITSDKSILGLRVIRGSDVFSNGTANYARAGVVVLFPYWSAVVAAAVLPLTLSVRAVRRARRARSGHCLTCGYDLRATSDRCPECGTPVLGMIPAAA